MGKASTTTKNKIVTARIDVKQYKKLSKKVGKGTISDYIRNLIEEDLA